MTATITCKACRGPVPVPDPLPPVVLPPLPVGRLRCDCGADLGPVDRAREYVAKREQAE